MRLAVSSFFRFVSTPNGLPSISAIKGSDDAAEFRLIDRVWVSEDCEIVRFEFAGQGCTVPVQGDDFLEAMLNAEVASVPVQRVM